jgi:hypothetical protein
MYGSRHWQSVRWQSIAIASADVGHGHRRLVGAKLGEAAYRLDA